MKRPSRLALLVTGAVVGAAIVLVRTIPRQSSAGTTPGRAAPTIRRAAVAGTFYPAAADDLREDVRRYLGEASAAPSSAELVALIVPHAGYVFSGPAAGYAFRALEGREYDTVVVVGPSHRVPFRGAALSEVEQWSTPLGRVDIDRAACEAVAKTYGGARFLEGAHQQEHSIEVQLPFLQTALGGFKLLPLLMADFSTENCNSLGEALAEWCRGRSALLVASSDMSHYPAYKDAARVDGETLEAIKTLDPDRVAATTRELMSQGVPGLSTCLCGEGPVRTVLTAARLLGADQVQVLRYANSGDVPQGSRERVVGYCAVAIYRTKSKLGQTAATGEQELSAEQRQRLLSVARHAVEEHVKGGRRLALEETDPALLRPGAAFVTLKKDGALRGCIGSLEADAPLIETVRNRAIDAATRDPRFKPVRESELPELEIEISVLSPTRRVSSAGEIDITRHGVIVASESRRGVFLPQVAQETGWSRDVLLSHLCRDKARLPADAWKKDAALYVFTVEAFNSPAPGRQSHVKQ
jgi:AmmeMemoRadiSam system protein B/AmmeMemoRadiSam system protein A